MRQAASSTSASLNNLLRLKRMAEPNNSLGRPMACSTGEGSSEPLEHAEPVEHATPARSNFISSTSAGQPGKEMFNVCGIPPCCEPFTTIGQASAHTPPTNPSPNYTTL